MTENKEVKPLIEEKHLLIQKLANPSNYTNKTEQIKDEKRIGKLNELIHRKTVEFIKQTLLSTKTIEPSSKNTIDIKALLNEKYKIYKELATISREQYKELVELKRIGKVLNEKLKKGENIEEELLQY